MNHDCLLLGFPEYALQGERLAKRLAVPFGEVKIHRFPDGESRLQLPETLPETVLICRSLDHPNEKLVDLLFTAAGARELGARRLILVAPYLCYMRQDKAFNPGELVSQRLFGRLLAGYFDSLVTVDSHLHRVHRLSDAVPTEQAINLTATLPMAHFLERHTDKPILIGPDEESEQWVATIAKYEGLEYGVASKARFGDRDVRVTLPEADYHGRNVVLVDDVASTGRTLAAAIRNLQSHQPASVSVLVTHALFAGDALQVLRSEGVHNIWSCDSIPHPSNSVFLDGLLGDCIREKLHIKS